ncbi:type II toxin-antitoxin system RatA family toxin [Orbaceae bacterium ac157xtp]
MAHVFYEIEESYSVEQMFNLVNDIASYPQFVPDCTNAGVLQKQDNLITAFIEVEKLGFKKKFTTINRLTPFTCIEMALIEGPFKHLNGVWNFTPLAENRCKISFELDFDLKNKVLNVTFTPLFKEVMKNMVAAFSHQAKKRYS